MNLVCVDPVRETHGTSLLDFYIEHSDQLQTNCWEHLEIISK